MKEEKTLRILIIEDEEDNIESSKQYFANHSEEFMYAKNFREAKSIIYNGNIDGVISDVFFPTYESHRVVDESEHQALGLAVGILCERKNIAYVLCSSEDHHRGKLKPICDAAGELNIKLVDFMAEWPPEDLIGRKDWGEAYSCLKKEISKVAYRMHKDK